MRKIRLLNGWIQICPNIVNYVEQDDEGIHLYYSTNKPWALYVGNRVVYRRKERMTCLKQAWEENIEVIVSLQTQLDAYLLEPLKKQFTLPVKGEQLLLNYEEVLFLKQGIDWVKMQLQYNREIQEESL